MLKSPLSSSAAAADSLKLRRPEGYRGQTDKALDGETTALRSNAVTLFPGDFQDEDSIWDDDEDDFFEDDQEEEMDVGERAARALREQEADEKIQKEKWIENSKPPIRFSKIDERGRSFGKGGRKTAKATVFIQPGLGEVVVNRQDYLDYFKRRSDRDHLLGPMVITDTIGCWDVQASVRGGGLKGQAGALRLAIANALNAYNPDLYRPPLKRQGMLERDARKVEPKRIGRVKARKRPQWVRR
jgi:small subunit ribosomal protein S9